MAAGTPGLGGRGLPRCIYAYMLMSCFVSSVRSSLRFNVPVEIPDDHDGHDWWFACDDALQCLHFHSAQHNSCSKLLQNDQMQLSTTERNNYDMTEPTCIHIRTNAGFQGPPHRPRSRSDCPLTGSAMPRSLAERIVEPRTRHAASALADRPVPGNHLPP